MWVDITKQVAYFDRHEPDTPRSLLSQRVAHPGGPWARSALVVAGPSRSDREVKLVNAPYDKPFLSLDQQISRLRQRGIAISDEAYARKCLRSISYNRLEVYGDPFRSTSSTEEYKFLPGTKFDDVVDLYIFDKRLRLMVMDAVDWIEVGVRAKWVSHMAAEYGAFGYIDRDQFRKDIDLSRMDFSYDGIREKLIKEFNRSHDASAKRYRKNSLNREEPPVWMAAESMSLGLLLNFIEGLKRPDRTEIASPFGLSENVLLSMIRNIHLVRNICAHHGRLWNRNLDVRAMLPRKPESLRHAMKMTTRKDRLHNTLVIMDYLVSVEFPEIAREWKCNLIRHLRSCPISNSREMGFPVEWKEWPSWSDS